MQFTEVKTNKSINLLQYDEKYSLILKNAGPLY